MPITLTTWNVQNFTRNDSNYSDKLGTLTGVLQNLDPDIVALQEILDDNALNDLAQSLGYNAYVRDHDPRGIGVAFMVRPSINVQVQQIDTWHLPNNVVVRNIDNHFIISDEPTMPRPALEITLSYNGNNLHVITAHLKSKLLTFGGNFSTTNETLRAYTAYFALERRAAETTTIREHVKEYLNNNEHVIVLGDFNDGSEAATTAILYGPPSSQPRGPEDSTNRNCAFQRTDDMDPQRLFNVTKFVPVENRWTRKYNGEAELLDQILVSEGLMPIDGSSKLRLVPNVEILNKDVPNMIGIHPIDMKVFPDHAPVTATFY